MSKGQDGNEPQEPSDFIKKLNSLQTEAILRQFEAKERETFSTPTPELYMAMNVKWKELVGELYYQPITTVKQVVSPYDGKNDTRRSDPRGNNYRESLTFSKVFFTKIKRKVGKKMRAFYIIDGIVDGSETKRTVFGSLSEERMYEVFGDNIASRIIAKGKKEVRGEEMVNVDIDVEAYWEVQFAPQKDQNDTKAVELSVEGICLRARRMEPIIMPGFYLENADNATKDNFSHESGKGRMLVGQIQKYPYTVLRQATMEEYVIFKEKGDAEQREFERHERDK